MTDADFHALLATVKKEGKLTVADIAWYLGRSHKTIRWWFKGRSPDASNRRYAHTKVRVLARAIERRAGFPVPELKKNARAEYMRLLGEGKLGPARVLAADPASLRLVRRPRSQERPGGASAIRSDAGRVVATRRAVGS